MKECRRESLRLLSNSRKRSQGVLRHGHTGVFSALPGASLTDGVSFKWQTLTCLLSVAFWLIIISYRSKSTFHRPPRHLADNYQHATPSASVSRTYPNQLAGFLTHTSLCCFYGHFPLFLVPPIHPIPTPPQCLPSSVQSQMAHPKLSPAS